MNSKHKAKRNTKPRSALRVMERIGNVKPSYQLRRKLKSSSRKTWILGKKNVLEKANNSKSKRNNIKENLEMFKETLPNN